jgi:catechol 2,3-dioxygenase-like lactoylglutathione lyase family enzyme
MRLKHIMMMVVDVPAARDFYSQGFGMEIAKSDRMWSELTKDGVTLALHHTPEPNLYSSSPILSFEVEDIGAEVDRLKDMGAELEGEVRQPSFGKVAAMRTPDGHLVSLLEPKRPS